MVVGPAVDMAAVVVETAGSSDNAEVAAVGNFDNAEVEAAGNFDTVVVVEAVGTDGIVAAVAVENVDIGVVGNLYYLVDAAAVERLYHTTKCNVFHHVLCRTLCIYHTHLDAGFDSS